MPSTSTSSRTKALPLSTTLPLEDTNNVYICSLKTSLPRIIFKPNKVWMYFTWLQGQDKRMLLRTCWKRGLLFSLITTEGRLWCLQSGTIITIFSLTCFMPARSTTGGTFRTIPYSTMQQHMEMLKSWNIFWKLSWIYKLQTKRTSTLMKSQS